MDVYDNINKNRIKKPIVKVEYMFKVSLIFPKIELQSILIRMCQLSQTLIDLMANMKKYLIQPIGRVSLKKLSYNPFFSLPLSF